VDWWDSGSLQVKLQQLTAGPMFLQQYFAVAWFAAQLPTEEG
jgi:hypothetical protein